MCDQIINDINLTFEASAVCYIFFTRKTCELKSIKCERLSREFIRNL